jgi:hypothetical protein
MKRRSAQAGMTRVAAGLAVLGLVACGQISHSGLTSSTTRVSVAPTPSGAPPSFGPLPTPTQFASVFGTCRLPVLVAHSPGETPAGWLEVPDGRYTPDPTTIPVAEKAYGTMAWDPAVGQWVPTYPTWISPDGTKYVAVNRSDIEIVDARTGATIHRISTTPNGPNDVIGYTSSAIYMDARGKQPPPGLWKVDTTSWTLKQISSAARDWHMANDTAAWAYGDLTVSRLDISTGVVTDLYKDRSGRYSRVELAGFAGSGVLLILSNDGMSGMEVGSVVVLHRDGSADPVDVPPALQHADLGGGFQDGPTVLLSASYPLNWPALPAAPHAVGLAAYDAEHGLQLVMGNLQSDTSPLGPCMSV